MDGDADPGLVILLLFDALLIPLLALLTSLPAPLLSALLPLPPGFFSVLLRPSAPCLTSLPVLPLLLFVPLLIELSPLPPLRTPLFGTLILSFLLLGERLCPLRLVGLAERLGEGERFPLGSINQSFRASSASCIWRAASSRRLRASSTGSSVEGLSGSGSQDRSERSSSADIQSRAAVCCPVCEGIPDFSSDGVPERPRPASDGRPAGNVSRMG